MATPTNANVAVRLTEMAARQPEQVAVAFPRGSQRGGRRRYDCVSFAELEADTEQIARALVAMGVTPGTRLALLVRPSIDFIALVFAMLKSGAVTVLIDPGMGRKNLLSCLDDVRAEGFVAIPPVHAVRVALGRRLARARLNVTVGRRWFWGGETLAGLRRRGGDAALPDVQLDDPAAIIFTSGSTGPPKGVLYTQRTFNTQVSEIQSQYQIEPGEVDLPGFPLFGLFNAAMGVTTIIPDMNPTRPAEVDPRKILEAMRDWKVTQAFGSPAMWRQVSRYCVANDLQVPTLRRVLSAGAPVPVETQRNMLASIHPEGALHTPYGATECLPVATISADEVLTETAARTESGEGVCVGRRFATIDWKIIRPADGPLASIEDVAELPTGEIGELIVRGPQVTREYVTRTQFNATSKIADGGDVWRRMGDVGYFDAQQRFWFCGRAAHVVYTAAGPLYPVCCEAIFNRHGEVERTALVGVGPKGQQRPVLVVELTPPSATAGRESLVHEQLIEVAKRNSKLAAIDTLLFRRKLPVDVRHNSKINREALAVWAARALKRGRS